MTRRFALSALLFSFAAFMSPGGASAQGQGVTIPSFTIPSPSAMMDSLSNMQISMPRIMAGNPPGTTSPGLSFPSFGSLGLGGLSRQAVRPTQGQVSLSDPYAGQPLKESPYAIPKGQRAGGGTSTDSVGVSTLPPLDTSTYAPGPQAYSAPTYAPSATTDRSNFHGGPVVEVTPGNSYPTASTAYSPMAPASISTGAGMSGLGETVGQWSNDVGGQIASGFHGMTRYLNRSPSAY